MFHEETWVEQRGYCRVFSLEEHFVLSIVEHRAHFPYLVSDLPHEEITIPCPKHVIRKNIGRKYSTTAIMFLACSFIRHRALPAVVVRRASRSDTCSPPLFCPSTHNRVLGRDQLSAPLLWGNIINMDLVTDKSQFFIDIHSNWHPYAPTCTWSLDALFLQQNTDKGLRLAFSTSRILHYLSIIASCTQRVIIGQTDLEVSANIHVAKTFIPVVQSLCSLVKLLRNILALGPSQYA